MKLRITNCELRIFPVAAARKNSSFFVLRSSFSRAFTLLELMVVVGIIGLIMAMGVPTLFHFFHKEGFRKSVGDMMEACSSARSRAILGQTTTELVFHPHQKSCEVSGGPAGGWGGWATKVQFGDDVTMSLGVNWGDYTDEDVAHVRFFPNGTSDEMELVLFDSKSGQWRGISLELTTGLPTLDMDIKKLMLR